MKWQFSFPHGGGVSKANRGVVFDTQFQPAGKNGTEFPRHSRAPETLGGLAAQVGAWPRRWVPAQRPQCRLSPTDLSGIYRQALSLF